MLNGGSPKSAGPLKPRLPQPKPQDDHRTHVATETDRMIAEVRGNLSTEAPKPIPEPQEKASQPMQKPKPGRPRKSETSSDSHLPRILVEIPVSAKNEAAYRAMLASQPEGERPAIQKRIVTRIRDMMAEGHAVPPWDYKGSVATISCRLRLDPATAKKIYDQIDPIGIGSQSSALGRAFAPYLNDILSRLPRPPA